MIRLRDYLPTVLAAAVLAWALYVLVSGEMEQVKLALEYPFLP